MRLATLNVENLYTRYRFAHGVDPAQAAHDGFTSEDLRTRIAEPDAKWLTAALIGLLDADVIALQEVEGMATLRRFRDRCLGGRDAWPHLIAIDGNDRRGIDVAVLSRWPIVHARSWQHLWDEVARRPLFSRDCLEVDVVGEGGTVISLFVNHFKSMRDDDGDGGRSSTRAVRERQCAAVRAIVEARFGADLGRAHWAVLGDFNDYLASDAQGESGIAALVHWHAVEDVVARLPADLRWTHFWRGRPERGLEPTYEQLDYLLLSSALARRAGAAAQIERRGQPGRAERYAGPRLEGVGFDRPKASDHCAVAIDLALG